MTRILDSDLNRLVQGASFLLNGSYILDLSVKYLWQNSFHILVIPVQRQIYKRQLQKSRCYAFKKDAPVLYRRSSMISVKLSGMPAKTLNKLKAHSIKWMQDDCAGFEYSQGLQFKINAFYIFEQTSKVPCWCVLSSPAALSHTSWWQMSDLLS